MRFSFLRPSLLTLLFIIALPVSAHAVSTPTIDFISPTEVAFMGVVMPGMNGTIDTDVGNTSYRKSYDLAVGAIPNNAAITFTYNAPPHLWGQITHLTTAEFMVNDDFFSLFTELGNNEASGNGISLKSSLSDDGLTITSTITNLSEFYADFSSFAQLTMPQNTSIDTSYAVVSAVPVPAALPLFALGLVGIAGYSRKKKKTA